MIAMPRDDLARVPEFSALFAAMLVVGFVWGALMGLLIFAAVGKQQQLAGS
jgi:hypothetical protein